MPSGQFLMEDFYYAGGLPAVLRELGELAAQDALTVNGKTIGENVDDAPCYNREVIRRSTSRCKEQAGIAVLRGNLAPDGAVIKPSAATPTLMKHRGRAVVFENIEDFHGAHRRSRRSTSTRPACMVLKNCGPKGYPGMAEVGNMPLPPKLLKKGITDMVRISDARMSGTAYGTVVLHVAPEAAAGGPLALVRERRHDRARRRRSAACISTSPRRSWQRRASSLEAAADRTAIAATRKLYVDHVLQADQGADLDFLVGKSGATVARESH